MLLQLRVERRLGAGKAHTRIRQAYYSMRVQATSLQYRIGLIGVGLVTSKACYCVKQQASSSGACRPLPPLAAPSATAASARVAPLLLLLRNG